jgi:hypothetical protein
MDYSENRAGVESNLSNMFLSYGGFVSFFCTWANLDLTIANLFHLAAGIFLTVITLADIETMQT